MADGVPGVRSSPARMLASRATRVCALTRAAPSPSPSPSPSLGTAPLEAPPLAAACSAVGSLGGLEEQMAWQTASQRSGSPACTHARGAPLAPLRRRVRRDHRRRQRRRAAPRRRPPLVRARGGDLLVRREHAALLLRRRPRRRAALALAPAQALRREPFRCRRGVAASRWLARQTASMRGRRGRVTRLERRSSSTALPAIASSSATAPRSPTRAPCSSRRRSVGRRRRPSSPRRCRRRDVGGVVLELEGGE